jgi:Carboxypeptidase regulatory-like domain
MQENQFEKEGHMRLARFRFLIVPVFFLFACVAAMAQQNSEIVGTVTDQTGAAVPGATLTLTQTETGFVYNTVSNSTGGYAFNGLNVGTYNLKASAKGFEGFTATGLALNVSQTLAQEIKLTIGAETVNVSVTADALQVQAESNTVSNLISGEQVTEIATENRNFTALAALGLGVSSLLPDNNTPTSVASSASISVNGLRESHNIWLIDGGEADDRGGAGGMDVMPSPDAIAQFEVLASNYPPDYGIASGATMSLSLKSGTQKFHGEAYDFLRNDDLDANYFFNKYNGADVPVAKLRQNVFGGNLGGPLFIPHLYNTNKQKTFFFYNQEWRRIIQGSAPNVQPTIPDADRPVAGQDLTYLQPTYAPDQVLLVPSATQVTDPAFAAKAAAAGLTQGQPFPTNSSGHQFIPASMFSPNAVLYLQSPLIPHVTNQSTDNSVSSIVNPINVWESIARIDHKVNDKWQILGHYIHDAVTQGYPDADLNWNWESYNTISSTLSNPSNSAAIKMSGEISPSLLVEASMNYDGNIINIVNSADALVPSGWGPANFFTNSGSNQFPGLNGLSGKGIGIGEETGYGGWHNAAEDYDPKVDISYTRGKHAFKFGFGYNRYTKNQQQQVDSAGDYSFGQNQTGNTTGGIYGDPFMSLVIGLSGGFSQPQSDAIRHYVNQTTSVYANDNWKVSPRFSLQIGFRYDALPHAWERNNALANFVPGNYVQTPPVWSTQTPGAIDPTSYGVSQPAGFPSSYYLNGMVFPGQPGVPHGLVNNDYNTFQPRVGFSYDLSGTGRTVLRGGFGTFYERMQGNDIYGLANSNLPFEYVPSVSNVYYDNPHCSWSSTASTANPANCLSTSNLPVLPASLTTLDTTYKAPATAQFSLGVQHELKPSLIWVVQYVGNIAWHQNVDVNLNNFPLNTPSTLRAQYAAGNLSTATLPGTTNELRTYQGYAGISQEENTTNGTYNGFQTGLRAQNKHGLSGELDYTYSHVIDLTDTDLQGVSNPWNLKYDKGSGEYDRRHILSGNYIYKLPVFNQSQGLLHTVLGGWELAGTVIAQSGSPISNNNSQAGFSGVNDTIGLGGGYTNRANVVNKIQYHHKVADWFGTPGTDGSADPLAAPTPGYAGGADLGFGDARRDTFVGPHRVNFTTSLYKSFAVTERAQFQLRVETFNTFNHTEFNNSIGVTTGGSNYGVETGTYDPRVMEVAGKFVF